jgi:hypothetical protein
MQFHKPIRLKSCSKNIGLIKCRECGIEKTRIRSGLDSANKFIYRDENGYRWNRLQCHACYKNYRIKHSRINNIHKDRSEVTDHKNLKGFLAERVVKEFFEKNGYQVVQTSCRGPDLVLSKNGVSYTCEVKVATRHMDSDHWFCSPIYPKRRKDDLMAIVLPGDKIHVEPMEAHLLACSISGRRRLTDIIKAYRVS